MIQPEATLAVLLIILSFGLIIPELFKRFRLPFVTTIIILGAIMGPYGLGYVELTETVEFFGFLGMTFLMLLAGIETDMSKVLKNKRKVMIMALCNGLIPFGVGVAITLYFGYSWLTSILVGIVFISSSVAMIVPALKSAKMFTKKTGQLILASVLIADIVSLIALGFVFQNIAPVTKLPLVLYYLILISAIIAMFLFIPKLSQFALKRVSKDIGYERKLRLVIIIIIGILLFFSVLGVHPILAAFLVGLMLSGVIHHDKTGIIYSKIHTLGYGIFVPVFFFIVGMNMDLSLFREFDLSNVIMISLILGLILSKLMSGYLAGKIIKLSNKDSLLFGSISTVQLTTTLAVTYTAAAAGILDNVIVTSIILLSIITTILGPIVVSVLTRKKKNVRL